MIRLSHNDVSRLCRVALLAIGVPKIDLSDSAIYDFSQLMSGEWDSSYIETRIAEWAQDFKREKQCKWCKRCRGFWGGVCLECRRDHTTGQLDENAFSYG